MDVWQGNSAELVGEHLALCTYLLGREDKLAGRFEQCIVVLPAHGVKLSDNHHYLMYTSKVWPGDLGSALFSYEGQLVGFHTKGIHHLQKLQRKEGDDINGRLKQLESFVSEANSGIANGCTCIAVLATAFKLGCNLFNRG